MLIMSVYPECIHEVEMEEFEEKHKIIDQLKKSYRNYLYLYVIIVYIYMIYLNE